MKAFLALFLAGTIQMVSCFQPTQIQSSATSTHLLASSNQEDDLQIVSRDDFLKTTSAVVAGAAASYVLPAPASARGRATLEQSYDRYAPRILAGGEFYSKDLRKLVEKSDWAGIKNALREPPKRSKEDKSKVDGGIAERAAQAGGFSDARVLVAADLFASAFSDNSISTKTKKMKTEVETLREIVQGMDLAARQGLGEVGGGGLFGFGSKKPSQSELSKTVRELYTKGGNAWNKYIFVANEELPVQLQKLPYIK